MLKKVYRGKTDINIRVSLGSGLSAQIDFAPTIGGGSIFYTTDTQLQSALESHPRYGKLYSLASTEDVDKQESWPRPSYSSTSTSSTEGAVSYLPQQLTESEKAQARSNIDAANISPDADIITDEEMFAVLGGGSASAVIDSGGNVVIDSNGGVVDTRQLNMTVDELNTLLTSKTNNGKTDTIPEILEQMDELETDAMTNWEIEHIVSNISL